MVGVLESQQDRGAITDVHDSSTLRLISLSYHSKLDVGGLESQQVGRNHPRMYILPLRSHFLSSDGSRGL